uniref:CAZy families GH4 protein n=1 Tax=uncultured Clavibacter sp. TaxID=378178 RepID=A0A060CIG0_9MICO|nr:CAZy families GH4 protein [uncultured Clavibacter sp.]
MRSPERIESFEEGRLFGAEWIQTLGALPNEYLHYYNYQREIRQADEVDLPDAGTLPARTTNGLLGVRTHLLPPLPRLAGQPPRTRSHLHGNQP